jgi:hypothetical protein
MSEEEVAAITSLSKLPNMIAVVPFNGEWTVAERAFSAYPGIVLARAGLDTTHFEKNENLSVQAADNLLNAPPRPPVI